MAKHAEPAAPIWFPNQRVWRTAVQVFASTVLGIAAFVAGLAVFAPQFLEAIEEVLPPSWAAWLGGAVAFVVAIAGAIARVMAIPGVNDWLTRHSKLGSAPSIESAGADAP